MENHSDKNYGRPSPKRIMWVPESWRGWTHMKTFTNFSLCVCVCVSVNHIFPSQLFYLTFTLINLKKTLFQLLAFHKSINYPQTINEDRCHGGNDYLINTGKFFELIEKWKKRNAKQKRKRREESKKANWEEGMWWQNLDLHNKPNISLLLVWSKVQKSRVFTVKPQISGFSWTMRRWGQTLPWQQRWWPSLSRGGSCPHGGHRPGVFSWGRAAASPKQNLTGGGLIQALPEGVGVGCSGCRYKPSGPTQTWSRSPRRCCVQALILGRPGSVGSGVA